MSDRRNRPPNRWGCKPTEDVCVEHDEPLICRHGCTEVKPHNCGTSEAKLLSAFLSRRTAQEAKP